MKKKIKLIWQFSGIEALKIAEHHLVHLHEYMQTEDLVAIDKGTELINEFSAISFVIIYNSFVDKLRLDLKPHKGFLVK